MDRCYICGNEHNSLIIDGHEVCDRCFNIGANVTNFGAVAKRFYSLGVSDANNEKDGAYKVKLYMDIFNEGYKKGIDDSVSVLKELSYM